MKNLEQMRRELISERGVRQAIRFLEHNPKSQEIFKKIDAEPFQSKVSEFASVLFTIIKAANERNETRWELSGAVLIIFLKRWPELYQVETVEMSEHGPN